MLTDRQEEIFNFIESFISENHYAPTRLEIAAEFEMNPNGAQEHLKAIEKKGFIRVIPKISRGIVIEKAA